MKDETSSPYFKKINQCSKIIESIENDKLGTKEA